MATMSVGVLGRVVVLAVGVVVVVATVARVANARTVGMVGR